MTAPAKKTKKTTLHNVVLGEISLVDRGANQGSAVLLFKRDDTEDEPMPKEPTQAELNALTEAVTKAEEALGELTLANAELVTKNDQLAGQVAALTTQLDEVRRPSPKTPAVSQSTTSPRPWASCQSRWPRCSRPCRPASTPPRR